ncbi:MAG TPA: malto-oligosyltrehalose synthase [Acidimicrobiales bacterium]|nr:malto-oligosyltrehalose synthase [Acidimicrobiales bacterium]
MSTESPRAPRRAARRATYRVQLHAGFPFSDAASIAGYLAELGVSHMYLSPVLQAAPGSTHGYDVVDPTTVNVELGGATGYRSLTDALDGAGLGQLLDVVPNHMAITGPENTWWWDVLENGPASVYASYFDVDWNPPESKLADTVLLPILGDHYGRELEAGRLHLRRQGGGFTISYFDHTVPVAPRSLDTLLGAAAADLAEGEAREELESVATAFGRLPHATDTDAASVHERHRDKDILRSRLAALCDEHPQLAKAVDARVDALNADPDALDALISRQNYRLAWWRTAAEELDYRRFFDINDLAAIRVEDPQVFEASHTLVLRWLAAGVVDGLRIDHIDGLRDPAAYLGRVQDSVPGAWLIVEKILEAGEVLPDRWPVAGTTGYDWLSTVGGLLVDPSGYERLLGVYRGFTGDEQAYPDVVHRAKLEVLDGPLSADLSRLVAHLARICERHRRYRDFTRRDLRDVLGEVIAGFDVYRTYTAPGREPDPRDTAAVARAVTAAAERRPDLDAELLGFLSDLLTLGGPESELAMHFQQLTGPVMAKAVEDTAFYRFVPLACVNEVGGDPGHPSLDLDAYHRVCGRNQRDEPEGLLALSTHDTKRSEDVRARIAVLAEIPDEWAEAVARFERAAERHLMTVTGAGRAPSAGAAPATLPDPATRWLAYQTLVGAWPLSADRLVAYLEKATREAKVHTSWTDPDPAYDAAVADFAAAVVGDRAFVSELEAFVDRVRRAGWTNSLTQKLLTHTAPGVGDLYQGTEICDLSLVDPDNRRPVDYDRRRMLLDRAASVDAVTAWRGEDGTGLTKLAVVRAALALRAVQPEWFGAGPAGSYQPLAATGDASTHAVASYRGNGPAVAGAGGGAVVVATRLPLTLEQRGGWGNTTLALPPGAWHDRLGGGEWEGTVAVGDVLAGLPVALLSTAELAGPEGGER